ncbi:MAG: superoxide dismutase [Caulobacteraceae bacterium]|nr:superoxide dismutase [Caulobacteraceae bacterium]
MSGPGLDRRQMLGAATLLAAAVPAAGAQAQPAAAPAVTFTPKPLPFDPKGIPGLSEKMLVSHHDNNYAGAVRRLGAIVTQFKALDPATAPVFQINGLKREELLAWNSMILHELYFAGLGGGARASAPLAAAIERDFGSEARWRAEFAGMGKALGGGSGWVLLTWSHRDNQLVNQWAADHTMTFAGGVPILALDMYEHAYAIDYGSNAGGYVDAFMGQINWATANQTFARV